ncbi:DUF1289 domain-containing protein [Pseudoalteromonas sp. NBT06-2]|uniref:DUF1289 domain-containing protein n=1 Tax=Pseudoalteromonas sp. NBT06-2 TaxID=2025950 RepID=UPI000BA6F06F|nr:DUF1289 domain-containing protein [Pseudoalteromonas sp. NBT06-2]PAJ76353.1 DUF1289 domain-containing protein [Pseudoalteromonas sp. NBT06-2]
MKSHTAKTKKKQYKTACIGQCHRLKGFCEGCGRTITEIQDWILLTQKEKETILNTPIFFDKPKLGN